MAARRNNHGNENLTSKASSFAARRRHLTARVGEIVLSGLIEEN